MTKKFIEKEYRTTEIYEVNDYEGYTDEEIINFCDPNNFGGYVYRYRNNAIVGVYID